MLFIKVISRIRIVSQVEITKYNRKGCFSISTEEVYDRSKFGITDLTRRKGFN
jgi:hypothetical protein